MKKMIFTALFFLLAGQIRADLIKIKVYFTGKWLVCRKEAAVYYRTGVWDTETNTFEGEVHDYTMSDQLVCSGNYSGGKKNGEFRIFYPDGALKLYALFRNDKPAGLWTWFFNDNKIFCTIRFDPDDFRIVTYYDRNGTSLMSSRTTFLLEIDSDTLKTRLAIKGTLKNGKRSGEWSLMNIDEVIGKQIYNNDKYISSVFEGNLNTKKKVISNRLFIPYQVLAPERMSFSNSVTKADYPFICSNLLPLEMALGVSDDSIFFQVHRKPLYENGIDGLNNTVAGHIEFPPAFMHRKIAWGSVFYQIIIDENGDVIDKRITRSPDKLLDSITLKALESLGKFIPAYHNGIPVKSELSNRIVYSLP